MTVTQEDIDQVREQFAATLEALQGWFDSRLEILERTIDAIEKQNALISVALGEQAVIIEGLTSMIDPEDYTEFEEVVKKSRRQMLEALRQGAEAIEGSDSKLASTLETMAE